MTGCSLFQSQQQPTQVVTKVEMISVPLASRPKPVQLVDTKIYVVTEENYEQFKEDFTDKNGDLVFIAISVKDYENLALNIGEIRRFLNQQTEVIVYYEEALTLE